MLCHQKVARPLAGPALVAGMRSAQPDICTLSRMLEEM